ARQALCFAPAPPHLQPERHRRGWRSASWLSQPQNTNRMASSACRLFAADVIEPNDEDNALVVQVASRFVRFSRLNTCAISSTRCVALRRTDLLARRSTQ